MTAIANELDKALLAMDAQSAAKLERVIRDVLDLASADHTPPEVDANGWPVGHFERTAGAFANEQFDIPEDPPPEPYEE